MSVCERIECEQMECDRMECERIQCERIECEQIECERIEPLCPLYLSTYDGSESTPRIVSTAPFCSTQLEIHE
jgi:hypothetical protein